MRWQVWELVKVGYLFIWQEMACSPFWRFPRHHFETHSNVSGERFVHMPFWEFSQAASWCPTISKKKPLSNLPDWNGIVHFAVDSHKAETQRKSRFYQKNLELNKKKHHNNAPECLLRTPFWVVFKSWWVLFSPSSAQGTCKPLQSLGRRQLDHPCKASSHQIFFSTKSIAKSIYINIYIYITAGFFPCLTLILFKCSRCFMNPSCFEMPLLVRKCSGLPGM